MNSGWLPSHSRDAGEWSRGTQARHEAALLRSDLGVMSLRCAVIAILVDCGAA